MLKVVTVLTLLILCVLGIFVLNRHDEEQKRLSKLPSCDVPGYYPEESQCVYRESETFVPKSLGDAKWNGKTYVCPQGQYASGGWRTDTGEPLPSVDGKNRKVICVDKTSWDKQFPVRRGIN